MGFNSEGKICLFDFDTAIYFPQENNVYFSHEKLGTIEYAPVEIIHKIKDENGELVPIEEKYSQYSKYTFYNDIYYVAGIVQYYQSVVSDYHKYQILYSDIVQSSFQILKIDCKKSGIQDPNCHLYLVEYNPDYPDNSNLQPFYKKLFIYGRPSATEIIDNIKKYRHPAPPPNTQNVLPPAPHPNNENILPPAPPPNNENVLPPAPPPNTQKGLPPKGGKKSIIRKKTHKKYKKTHKKLKTRKHKNHYTFNRK
jgi:hypothetical protein